MEINKVAVIGTGLMGSGIAYVVANSGRDVVLVDQKQEFLDAGMSKIREQIKDGITRGKLSPKEGENLSKKFSKTLDLAEALQGTDMVIEAVFENMEVKKDVFKRLSDVAGENVILASNTSTLSITELANVTKKPSNVVGLHFFSPVPAMKLVEIVSGADTNPEITEAMTSFVESISKTPVHAKNSPGFIVNRLLLPMLNEAMKLLDNGIATKEDIDKAAVLGASFPAGPFTLADMVGLDVALASMRTLEKELGDCYKPSTTLVSLVEAGKLGMKTKSGFYEY